MNKRELILTECKSFNCAWRRFNRYVPPRGDVTISLRCANNCGSERHDVTNRHDGSIVHRSYVRPNDWKEGIRLSKDELRLALIRHTRSLRAVS